MRLHVGRGSTIKQSWIWCTPLPRWSQVDSALMWRDPRVWICTKKIQEVSTVFFNTETSGIDPPLAPDLAAAFAFASNKYGFFGCQSKEDSKGLQLMKLKLPEAARSALRKPLEFHWSRFRGLTGSRWSWPHWIKRETWGWWQEFCNSQEKQKTCMDRYDMYIYIYIIL